MGMIGDKGKIGGRSERARIKFLAMASAKNRAQKTLDFVL
jgi:hypothetical protein